MATSSRQLPKLFFVIIFSCIENQYNITELYAIQIFKKTNHGTRERVLSSSGRVPFLFAVPRDGTSPE